MFASVVFLTHSSIFFNLSLQTGIFRNGIKVAQIYQFFKKMKNSFFLITHHYQYHVYSTIGEADVQKILQVSFTK